MMTILSVPVAAWAGIVGFGRVSDNTISLLIKSQFNFFFTGFYITGAFARMVSSTSIDTWLPEYPCTVIEPQIL
ncbi:hypothetical protein [Mucilaginibacter metallidurans]|uniref:hypothetical protein n=1 Tax=Mucilaginibacter sp. P4 TaxID=3383180 RepID=UPI001AD60DF7|nr:hypothetical protein [Mucilaginibacter gossypii]